MMKLSTRLFGLLLVSSVLITGVVYGAEWKTLPGHVPSVVSKLSVTGRLAATNQMRLAIGLPLRDPAGLSNFLAEVYNPPGPRFRHFLTVDQLTARFGPTEQDYEAVKAFVRGHGLAVTGTFGNRLVLDVMGPAAAVEKAWQITLRTYRHPTEARTFYAPDREPRVAATLPVVDIQGLTDYARPHAKRHRIPMAKQAAKGGSAPDGSGAYFGNDFRNAYVPGTALTGAGQMVGLFEFDGFYTNDVVAYAQAAGGGRSHIPIQVVQLEGFDGIPTDVNNSSEVSLDIDMAMAMAPGLAGIVVFEADTNGLPNDLLDAMLTYSNTVHQLSCSWGWGGGPSNTTEAIFQSMDAVGQSFFNASGDTDAFTAGNTSSNSVDNPELQNAPSSSPSITQAGATTLTMKGTGSGYSSETVWNWGVEYGANYDGVGSSGGVSSYYPIPWWQTNVANMTTRGGSTSNRNIPDVALTGDNVFEYDGGNQAPDIVGGTSCAAPLWAGFMALVNQSAAEGGWPEVGFINPAIYAIAAGSNYSTCFHDITTGNNTWSESPDLFQATAGYDLCTGLGTPNGMFLVAALGGDPLGLAAGGGGYDFTGPAGGPFSPVAATLTLTNTSTTTLIWTVTNNASWLSVGVAGGSLVGRGYTNVTITLLASATNYATGYYLSSLMFSNATLHVSHQVPVALDAQGVLTGLTAVWDNGVQLAWNALAGQSYQVQYKTNLAQVDWINLGSSVTAGAATVSVTDTNGVQSSLQRFYRVSLVQ